MALLKSLQSDNVVYHGLAGHFYVNGVSHVLKVRIIADLEERSRLVMEREKISHESAEERIRTDDAARRKWSRHLYGIDTNDPGLYDLVIRVRNLSVDDVAKAICHTVTLGTFNATPESRQAIEDLLLAGEVKSALMALKPDIQVAARGGEVSLGVEAHLAKEPSQTAEMVKLARLVPGVRNVSVETRQD
ncbi:MAG: AAA family ATPase [Syntrophobacteraceae bacterium]